MSKIPHQNIRTFLDYLKFQKRYSEHTIISYENDLSAFFDFLKKEFDESSIKGLNPTMVRSWLAGMKSAGMSSKSINRKISSLKSFFKFQLREGTIKVSPMTTIISPKQHKLLPQYIEKKDMDTLFDHVEFPANWCGRTDRLLLEILYNTGIRQAELIGLKEHHVDFKNNTIKVLGKGSKERIIPVSNHLLREIKEYSADKIQLGGDIEMGILLINQKGRKLYPKYVYNVTKKYLSLITTINKKSPHIIRHSFATHLMNNGAELNAVKELLGHTSLASTQVYTHNSIEKLKDVFKKAHPKAG